MFGAADPNSGTASLIEVARGLGALLRTGWQPQNSIMLCSWSGEEYGLLGSTAWGEVNGDDQTGALSKTGILSRASAYLNVDVGVSWANFGASGTPSLGKVLMSALRDVKDPATQKPLSELWGQGKLYALGSGSDYTVFIDHLGIPSIDMHFSPEATYGVYHSTFDSFAWMATEGDPTFEYHVAMSQIWGIMTLRLAGTVTSATAPLPVDLTLQARAIDGYVVDLKASLNSTTKAKLDFETLETAVTAFSKATQMVQAEQIQHIEGKAVASSIHSLNERVILLKRQFLTVDGLPGRKWFRHCLQAPGLYTGYAPQMLPGIAQPIADGKLELAQQQIGVVAQRIEAAAADLQPPATSRI